MARKQRTPEQLIAETQERLAKLQARQAKKTASNDPKMAPLFEDLEAQKKIIREAKKGLGDGPQSFSERIAKHEAWIAKIQLEEMNAESDLKAAEAGKILIERQITQAVAESLASPTTVQSENSNSN